MHLPIERERMPRSARDTPARGRSFRVIRLLLRKRKTRRALLITFGILLLLRVVDFVPLPGVDLFGTLPR